jgi:very-short-patch-repair endonuclease
MPPEETFDEFIESLPITGLPPDVDWADQFNELHRVAMRAILMRCAGFFSTDYEDAAAHCESPPEVAMLYALAIVAWDYADGVLLRFDRGAGYRDGSGLISTRATMVEIEPQAEILDYRVDFLLTMSLRQDDGDKRAGQLIVECDGHDFHERTKEQASRGHARDRALQSAGYGVYHYTGSDVWRDVFKAAEDAIQALGSRM